MPNFVENNFSIEKNNDAFYQKYYCKLHIKRAKLMHQIKLCKVVETTYSTECNSLEQANKCYIIQFTYYKVQETFILLVTRNIHFTCYKV